MGMFDSIKVDADNICNIALPDGEYQTYDLDNQCWDFRITKEGKLVVETAASDFDGESGVNHFNSWLENPSTIIHDIANNKFGGIIEIGSNLAGTEKSIAYLLLIHDNEILFVMSYGEIIYSRDPESNNDFREAIERACTPMASDERDMMFQQIMSTKHLMPESRSAAASLMTAEDAPKAMERELQARKANLLKGKEDGNKV